MARQYVNPPELYNTSAIYSHAVKVGDTVYMAGVVGLEKDVRPAGDSATQIEKAYQNLLILLKASGATLEDLVSTRVYLTREEDIPLHRDIRKKYTTNPATPYSQFIVKALGRADLRIEIECTAVLDR